jgi:hypothetical protein
LQSRVFLAISVTNFTCAQAADHGLKSFQCPVVLLADRCDKRNIYAFE